MRICTQHNSTNFAANLVTYISTFWDSLFEKSQVRSPKSVRNSSYATRRRRGEREELLCVRAPYTASHIFSPNRPLCENTEQKPAPVKCNAHYTSLERTIMNFSTVIIVGPAYDHLYDTSTWTGTGIGTGRYHGF